MDDILAALTRRVSELEERLATTQADLRAERGRLASYAESAGSLNAAAADSHRRADAILQSARATADKTLVAAADERRVLMNEVALLREEHEDLNEEIASLRSGEHVAAPQRAKSDAPAARDLQTAIATEMRTLLVELLADFRAGPPASPAVVEPVAAAPVPSEPVVDEYIEDLRGSRQSA